MDCDSGSNSVTFNLFVWKRLLPFRKIGLSRVFDDPGCERRATVSKWFWNLATIENFADGILTITVKDPQSPTRWSWNRGKPSPNRVISGIDFDRAGRLRNQATGHLLREGKKINAIVFQDSDLAMTALVESGDSLVFTYRAFGAEKLRYSVNSGKNWTDWRDWEDSPAISKPAFKNEKFFWKCDHVIMNCM